MEEQAYTGELKQNIGIIGGNHRLSDVDKTPIQSAISNLGRTLNQLGEEVDRLSTRTSSVRNLVPTESTELDESRKEYGSALFAELTRLDNQANHIMRNLQSIIGEIEL